MSKRLARVRAPRRQAGAFAWPLICYLGFTLGVPLVNGAHARQGFWLHVAIVVVTVAALRAVWSRMTNQNRT